MSDQREGPKEIITRSCQGCRFVRSEHYQVQGDSGFSVYCDHSANNGGRHIGDTTWNTPAWCPVILARRAKNV